MVGSHEGEPCRLFDQAIYTYLISCRVGSGFRVGLSGQASQPDPSARVQLLNPTRHFSKKNPTRPDAVSLISLSISLPSSPLPLHLTSKPLPPLFQSHPPPFFHLKNPLSHFITIITLSKKNPHNSQLQRNESPTFSKKK